MLAAAALSHPGLSTFAVGTHLCLLTLPSMSTIKGEMAGSSGHQDERAVPGLGDPYGEVCPSDMVVIAPRAKGRRVTYFMGLLP